MNTTDSIPTQVLIFLSNGARATSREIANALGMETKKVSSALSRLVKKGTVLKDGDQFYLAVVEAEEPVSEPEENLIGAGEPTADDAPENAEEDVFITGCMIDFPGNYSIAFAPGAAKIAEAAGVRVQIKNVPGKLNRHVFLEDGPAGEKVCAFITAEVPAVLRGLKAWQKENIESRRGLTDMQRYLQHRDYITEQMNRLAIYVRENGI